MNAPQQLTRPHVVLTHWNSPVYVGASLMSIAPHFMPTVPHLGIKLYGHPGFRTKILPR